YFSLPARKEGIIPGASPRRLAHFLGDRLTRQAVMFERGFDPDSAEGRLLCDEVVEAAEMDAAIERNTVQLTSSGAVSAAANRKAIRLGRRRWTSSDSTWPCMPASRRGACTAPR